MSAQEMQSEIVGFRLSPQQEQVLAADDDHSVVQCAAVLAAPIPDDAVRRALAQAVARHEILRTTFPRAVGMRGRSQVVHDQPSFDWSTADAADDLDDALTREAQRGFDLDRGPLLRALLLAPTQPRPVLVLTAHAACADARSLMLLLGELARSYSDGAGGGDEPVQYADYAEWRHELITGEDDHATDGREFWARQSEDRRPAPRLLFSTAQARSGRTRRVRAELDLPAGTDQGAFLEACWHALLARLTGAGEILLAGWCDGRAQPDLLDAVGPYAQPVAVRSRVEPDTSFAEVLDQVTRARGQATVWQDFAAADDLAALSSDALAGFVYFGEPAAADPELEIAALNPAGGMTLMLAAHSRGETTTIELWHNPAVYDEHDAADIARRLRTLVRSAAADRSQPVARLALIEPDERRQLIAAAAGPAAEDDAAIPVHELFERRAALTPDAPAVADGEGERSYRDVNAAANRLAHLLRELGITPASTVGLCMERTPALLEAVLGILKAGGAYVPLNYEHPPARLAHQLNESGARVLLTEEHLLERVAPFDGATVCVDRDRERIAAQPADDPDHVAGATDLVYVMYTSGSTGLPKGVAVTHANLSNYALHIARRLGAETEALRFGVVSAISTDLGNTSIFPALVSGGCVQLVSPGASMDSDAMAAELRGHALDVLKITPSHLGALINGDRAIEILPRRWLVLGGEALSWDLVARVRALNAPCAVINHYGPTETTVGCLAYDVEAPRADSLTVPIGRPLAGVRAYVLDASFQPQPPGVPGELCIAGHGVANGYIARAQDTARAFVEDALPGERIYRTGDRARYLRDGAVEFLGRLDDQVKIRGFRIEPGEIEAALAGHPAVRQAAVVPERDDRGETRLVAYIATSADPSVEDLQAFLARSLPEYMVPAAFAKLDSLPFTPSGKIDRRALASLAALETRREAEYVAPRDAIEQEIAAIWGDLLGIEQVGVFDDFFALGGHSLLATQAIMRIRRGHGNIPLRALLAAPTVADLAEVVRRSGPAAQQPQ